VAARLRGIYGTVDNVDAFAGMSAERHVPGTDFGELQLAIWKKQFQALRDGDRFFYQNDPGLSFIKNTYGIDFQNNLGDIIALNTDIPRAELPGDVFFEHGHVPPASCRVVYSIFDQWTNAFQVNFNSIQNTGSTSIPGGWALHFSFPNGQAITQIWNATQESTGGRVTVSNAAWNPVIGPGAAITDAGFIGSWNNVTNGRPARFTLNSTRCTAS
jgi:hypothetical protein